MTKLAMNTVSKSMAQCPKCGENGIKEHVTIETGMLPGFIFWTLVILSYGIALIWKGKLHKQEKFGRACPNCNSVF